MADKANRAKPTYYLCRPQFSTNAVRCIFSERRRDSLRGDPPRCPTHGAVLEHAPQFDGLPEAQAKALHLEAEQAAGRI